MTYRERRLRRAERLRGWSEKRLNKSAESFEGARRAVDGIEPGQPILVGHHSERRHRAALDRHDSRMRQGFEHLEKGNQMASRAAEIERQAEHAIYSDDDDAVERLRERIAGLEAERDRVKAINATIRKHGLAGLTSVLTPPATQDEAKDLAQLAALCPWHDVAKRGYPSYKLQNLSGNIARQRARLEQLEIVARQRAAVAAALAAEQEEQS